MIERSAFIGGCDGVAVTKSAQLLGEEPIGTMPHALILVLVDTIAAVRASNKIVDPNIKRVALIDTFNDEKFETIRVAQELGLRLFAVRVDTPASRKGNLRNILSEMRWELNYRGFHHVKIFVSGGLDEHHILELNDLADSYGRILGIEIREVRKVAEAAGRREIFQGAGKERGFETVLW